MRTLKTLKWIFIGLILAATGFVTGWLYIGGTRGAEIATVLAIPVAVIVGLAATVSQKQEVAPETPRTTRSKLGGHARVVGGSLIALILGVALSVAVVGEPSTVSPLPATRCPAGAPTGLEPDKYQISFNYGHGDPTVCTFNGQYAWMVATRDAVAQGITQHSGYFQVVVMHGAVAVQANFCATGTRCGVQTSFPHATGISESDSFTVTSYTECGPTSAQVSDGPSNDMIEQFVQAVSKVHFKNLVAVTLTSSSGNRVTYNPACPALSH